MRSKPGFTIVELLVVIVVIGVLAAITIVSYSGISNQAVVASLKSDLSGAAKNFKLYNVEYGSYPTAITETSGASGVWCASTPTADSKYCLKLSGGNLRYSYTGTINTFKLVARNGSNFWSITEGSEPIALTVPILINPTSTAITSAGATIGATIQSDGGLPVTESGTCWETSTNPAGNCTPIIPGLSALSPSTIAAGTAPQAIAISVDGKSLYAPNYGTDNSVSMYSRDINTGLLTTLGTPTISAGTAPRGIAISPDGTSVYVTNRNSNNISMYSRNTSTGALTALSPSTMGSVNYPFGIVVSSDSQYVYVANETGNSVSMFSRNTSTGQLTALSPATIPSGSAPFGIAISADGKSIYTSNYTSGDVSMFSRNTSTGQLTALSPATIATGTNPYQGITVSPDGTSVYVANWGANNVSMYSRNTTTGALTALGTPTITSGTRPRGIVVSNDGTSVYVNNQNSNNVSIYSRNKGTGALTSLGTIPTGLGPQSIAITSNDASVYVPNSSTSNNISMYGRSTVGAVGVPFSHIRTGMLANTFIYYRGYAINDIGTGYSPNGTFTTSP